MSAAAGAVMRVAREFAARQTTDELREAYRELQARGELDARDLVVAELLRRLPRAEVIALQEAVHGPIVRCPRAGQPGCDEVILPDDETGEMADLCDGCREAKAL